MLLEYLEIQLRFRGRRETVKMLLQGLEKSEYLLVILLSTTQLLTLFFSREPKSYLYPLQTPEYQYL
jgi:hypothetical protein